MGEFFIASTFFWPLSWHHGNNRPSGYLVGTRKNAVHYYLRGASNNRRSSTFGYRRRWPRICVAALPTSPRFDPRATRCHMLRLAIVNLFIGPADCSARKPRFTPALHPPDRIAIRYYVQTVYYFNLFVDLFFDAHDRRS